MFGKTHYHGLIKRYVTLFGTLFNDIWINRADSSGNVKQSFKVPINYGPREKFLARIVDIEQGYDPQEQPFAIVAPRIGFEISNIQYAAERKLPTNNRDTVVVKSTDTDVKRFFYNPVPYDIFFTLSVFVKNAEDGAQIIEQILPYFAPDWTPTVRIIDSPEVIKDIPVVLTSLAVDDVYEGSWTERRSLIWTLEFTMKAYFYGPVRESGIITLANTNIFDELFDTGPRSANITVIPGQDANGAPTSNSALTVDRSLIDPDSTWEYITTIVESTE